MPKQFRPILTDDQTFQMVNQYKADYRKNNKSEAIKEAILKARIFDKLKADVK